MRSCSGAFSVVKLATNKKSGEKCAVKMVNKQHPEFTLESLAQECGFMQRVGDHKNIIEFKALYETRQTFEIVVEYMCGGELFDIIIQRVRRSSIRRIRDRIPRGRWPRSCSSW